MRGSTLMREKRRHVRRPREVDQPGGRSVVLHERHPLEIVIGVGRLVQKLVGLAFEDAQDAAFLRRPRFARHAEILQIPRKRTVQRPTLVAFAAKCPIGIRWLGDQRQERLPGFQPEDAVRASGPFASGHLLPDYTS
jgi:hypothetical protein